jgi:hypothetical protein
MPIGFLTAAERERLSRFPEHIPEDDLRVSPKSLLCHSPVAERPIDIGGFEALEHQVHSTDP